MATEQELFEKAFTQCPAARTYKHEFPKNADGTYAHNLHQMNWELWQLARNAYRARNEAPTDYDTARPANYVAPTDKYYVTPKGAV